MTSRCGTRGFSEVRALNVRDRGVVMAVAVAVAVVSKIDSKGV